VAGSDCTHRGVTLRAMGAFMGTVFRPALSSFTVFSSSIQFKITL
jgi:hypothetical protein